MQVSAKNSSNVQAPKKVCGKRINQTFKICMSSISSLLFSTIVGIRPTYPLACNITLNECHIYFATGAYIKDSEILNPTFDSHLTSLELLSP